MIGGKLLVGFSTLLCMAIASPVEKPVLAEGVVRYVEKMDDQGRKFIQATDGVNAVIAKVTDGGFETCHVDKSKVAVQTILSNKDAREEGVGLEGIEEMYELCKSAGKNQGRAMRSDETPVPSNSSYSPFDPEDVSGQADGAGITSFTLYPGTNWCGMGNKAEKYEHLGSAEETDKCCRDHDHCEYHIPLFTTKYNAFNKHVYTLSWCGCDKKFHGCLEAIKTETSKAVQDLFFKTFKVDCFNFAYGRHCSKWGVFRMWCKEYSVGNHAQIVESWS